MLYFLGFNGVMLLAAILVLAKLVSVRFLTPLITGLHYTIGISTPTEAQVRRAVVIWIVSVVVIVDVLFSLLRWAF
jgi:TRAP-type C4-dicarboxylate transport system permease large subunit